MNAVIEKSEFRYETRHCMTRRCEGWDYRARAIYMITLVQEDRRRPLLGRLAIEDEAASPEAVAAHVEPSELGAAILAHWQRIGEFTSEIKPLYCQLMPDHLHAILEVMRPMAKPLGIAIGGFKTGCEKIYRKLALSAQNRFGGAAAINYHGATFAEIDSLAREAVSSRSVPEAQTSGSGF